MNTTISNIDITPEEERRQAFHVAIVQEAPELILNLLVDIVDNKDWRKFVSINYRKKHADYAGFIAYVTKPYSESGIGFSAINLKQIYQWEHRAETQASKTHEHERLATMRDFVRAALGDDLEPVMDHTDAGKLGGRGNKASNNITSFRGDDPDYKLRRLKKERPDLAQRVIDGGLSANAAAIEAGFTPPKISIRLDNMHAAARTLKNRLTREQREELAFELMQD